MKKRKKHNIKAMLSALTAAALLFNFPLYAVAQEEELPTASEEISEPETPADTNEQVPDPEENPADPEETDPSEQPSVPVGDVDQNGSIDISDASDVLNFYAMLCSDPDLTLQPYLVELADVDGDSAVTITDSAWILSYYAAQAANITNLSLTDFIIQQQEEPPVTTTAPAEISTETTTETTVTSSTDVSSTAEETTTAASETTVADTTSTEITTTETTTTETTTTETSTTETTITETTTTVTTTTELPVKAALAVNCILQEAYPSLPTGCEATALTIALNYDGFNVSKSAIATTYLPKMSFTTYNGADFTYVFPGDPTTYYGYGCYAPAITATADAYFTSINNASYAENLSGLEFEQLFPYIASGRPVVFWGTMSMSGTSIGESWSTPDGKYVTWKRNEHCLVLTGYDLKNGVVYVADPLRGNVTYNMALVKQRYNEVGKNAVIIHPSSEPFTYDSALVSGEVYRLRNAGTGKYLTVANGTDANGVNIIQADESASAEQQCFRLLYQTAANAFHIAAMCSSNGENRVVDIIKIGGSVVGGCNVDLYTPVDAIAQDFVPIAQADGSFVFFSRTNRNACLAAVGSENGSSAGTAYTSSGNVVIQTYTGAASQRWFLVS